MEEKIFPNLTTAYMLFKLISMSFFNLKYKQKLKLEVNGSKLIHPDPSLSA